MFASSFPAGNKKAGHLIDSAKEFSDPPRYFYITIAGWKPTKALKPGYFEANLNPCQTPQQNEMAKNYLYPFSVR